MKCCDPWVRFVENPSPATVSTVRRQMREAFSMRVRCSFTFSETKTVNWYGLATAQEGCAGGRSPQLWKGGTWTCQASDFDFRGAKLLISCKNHRMVASELWYDELLRHHQAENPINCHSSPLQLIKVLWSGNIWKGSTASNHALHNNEHTICRKYPAICSRFSHPKKHRSGISQPCPAFPQGIHEHH